MPTLARFSEKISLKAGRRGRRPLQIRGDYPAKFFSIVENPKKKK